MSTVSLVYINGPSLIFGGPYSNLQATRAVLAEASRIGIAPDHVICTGDLIAYCGDPAGTIDLVRDADIRVIMGNCDQQLAIGADNCACGFPSGSTCERLSSAWFEYAARHVQAPARAWLGSLPSRMDLQIGGKRLAVIHGGVSQINRFVFASTSATVKQRELELANCDGIICGHSGLPFSQVVNGRLWHNAGVIGMPANDGTPTVWFSVLTPGADGIRIEHRALAYDHHAAAAAMERAGLPAEYRRTLSSGLWPCCDVLPYREIRVQGSAIEPGAFTWKTDDVNTAAKRPNNEPSVQHAWPLANRVKAKPLDPLKFKNPVLTAKGEPRATVALKQLKTLWFNTGTLCNITCRNCYIESSPRNDRLSYLTVEDIRPYLDEIERDGWGTREIGFTGGEPFMNPQIVEMLEECLARGFEALVLTNAMRPMQLHKNKLTDLNRRYGARLTIRVSLDHYSAERHEDERGLDTFAPTWDGMTWLADNRFKLAVAGRTMWGEDIDVERAGYGRLFARHSIPIDVHDPGAFVLFPEMDLTADVPEITTSCWETLGKSPDSVMCATSRMVVKRKGQDRPVVLSCTLLPYNEAFELGTTLRDADRTVPLNHPHCAKFCVLGGASCSSGSDAETLGEMTHANGTPARPVPVQACCTSAGKPVKSHSTNGSATAAVLAGIDVGAACCGTSSNIVATRDVYRKAALAPDRSLCCATSPVWTLPELVVPKKMTEMNYGCGTTVHPGDLANSPNVLYVGVGGGLELLQFAYFSRRRGAVIGMDIVPEMIDACRDNLAEAERLNPWFAQDFIDLRNGDAMRLPIADSAIDVAAQNCLFNIFHDEDLTRALAEMHRVLKPNGRLLLSDPICETEMPEALRRNERLRAMCLTGAIPLQDYISRLAKVGFGTVEVRARRPYRVLGPGQFATNRPIVLESVEICAIKSPVAADGPTVFAGQTAIYFGAEPAFSDGNGLQLPSNQPLSVSVAVAAKLKSLARSDIYVTEPTWCYSNGAGSCC